MSGARARRSCFLSPPYPPDIGILADARTFLRQLLADLEHRKPRTDGALQAWHAEIKGWQQEWDAFTRPNLDIHATPIRPEYHSSPISYWAG